MAFAFMSQRGKRILNWTAVLVGGLAGVLALRGLCALVLQEG
jgi:hypothetical protein